MVQRFLAAMVIVVGSGAVARDVWKGRVDSAVGAGCAGAVVAVATRRRAIDTRRHLIG
jgi:hypothetical protein